MWSTRRVFLYWTCSWLSGHQRNGYPTHWGACPAISAGQSIRDPEVKARGGGTGWGGAKCTSRAPGRSPSDRLESLKSKWLWPRSGSLGRHRCPAGLTPAATVGNLLQPWTQWLQHKWLPASCDPGKLGHTGRTGWSICPQSGSQGSCHRPRCLAAKFALQCFVACPRL